MKNPRTAGPSLVVESPTLRSLPLVELLVDTKAELFELMVRSGLQVLGALLEEDRAVLCGPRYAHPPKRRASRAGTVPSEVVLGGRKVATSRLRVRAEGREVPLPTFQALAQADPLNRRVVEQMLVGVATRQYARSLESVPAGVVSRGTSKSSVSRRFVAKTAAQLRTWQSAPPDGLDLVALLLDGVHIGEHCFVVALGIAADGQKHALGLWEGATENAVLCQRLLANLQSRGLRTDAACSCSSMAPWPYTKRCARSSARPPSFSGARSTSSAISWTICRSGSGPGYRRSCGAPIWRPR